MSALGSSARQGLSDPTLHNESREREARRTGPSGPQEMAIQALQAFHRHNSCFAITCRSSRVLYSELSQSD